MVAWIISPLKSSPKWPLMCRLGTLNPILYHCYCFICYPHSIFNFVVLMPLLRWKINAFNIMTFAKSPVFFAVIIRHLVCIIITWSGSDDRDRGVLLFVKLSFTLSHATSSPSMNLQTRVALDNLVRNRQTDAYSIHDAAYIAGCTIISCSQAESVERKQKQMLSTCNNRKS